MERTKWMKIVGSTALACFAVCALAFVPDIAQAQGKVEYKWRLRPRQQILQREDSDHFQTQRSARYPR
jgi:hypothetical protein